MIKSTANLFEHKMHPHSLEAYRNLNLTKRQAEVYAAFEVLGSATDLKIAEYLGWGINRVSGRVGELVEKGILEECGYEIIGKEKHRICRIKNGLARVNTDVENRSGDSSRLPA